MDGLSSSPINGDLSADARALIKALLMRDFVSRIRAEREVSHSSQLVPELDARAG